MSQLVGMRGQTEITRSFPVRGSITTGGTAQLLLPVRTRTYLLLQNTSDTLMTIGVGGATATAAISGGAVSTISVANAGMGYTKPPQVIILGGVGGGLGFPNPPAETNQATAHAVLSGATIGSIVVDNGGAGYTVTPYILLVNHPDDITGSFAPSATAGFQLVPGGSWSLECSTVLNDQIAIFGATTGKTFEGMVVM